VDAKEGQELATEFGVPFFECSAKTGSNVEKAMVELGSEALRIVEETAQKAAAAAKQDDRVHVKEGAPGAAGDGKSCPC